MPSTHRRVAPAAAAAFALLPMAALAQGTIPSGNAPTEFAKFIADETTHSAKVVKASGPKVD